MTCTDAYGFDKAFYEPVISVNVLIEIELNGWKSLYEQDGLVCQLDVVVGVGLRASNVMVSKLGQCRRIRRDAEFRGIRRSTEKNGLRQERIGETGP